MRILTGCCRNFLQHAAGREYHVQDLQGGADPEFRLNVRVVTELAWHALFIRHMLRRPPPEGLANQAPDLTILNFPSFRADPAIHGCRSETVVAIDLDRRLVLAGGHRLWPAENKKAVFTYLNFLLPARGVLPMHCSANHAHGQAGRRRHLLRPVGNRPRPRCHRIGAGC